MGRTVGTLGPAPAVAAAGPMATGPTVVRPAVGGSTIEEPAVGKGPTAGGVGPWRTRGLKE